MITCGLYWCWYEWGAGARLAFPPGLVLLELRLGPLQFIVAHWTPLGPGAA